ncbi:hypothetical protein [Actinomadura mexicana]|uniref:Uncharacterized protein n=1 Tax=Actinomadura mexicana TaxID=134959 RepID=A0A239C3J8_9ACTN|nr:hypothetical protein [Actinomadura mexicana]SNS13943.1 hypothetical protein SAMN06265355_111224 [Actinomadura mexicana]
MLRDVPVEQPESAAPHCDWVFVCAHPGAVISVSVRGEGRTRAARVVAFLDSGQTLWSESGPGGGRKDFDMVVAEAAGRSALRIAVGAREAGEPVELGGDARPRRAGRIPLLLDVALAPLAPPARLGDATGGGVAVTAQAHRLTGTLAVGSVIHRVSGQAWSSRSPFASTAVRAGSRVHAVFQDDSGLYAARTDAVAGGRLAALQLHNAMKRLDVPAIRVAGPERGVPWGVTCELGTATVVTGAPRHSEGYQHVAFLRPDGGSDTWVRAGYTPFDFVRAGRTGLGLLEHVTRVPGPERPEPGPRLPDPWD